MAVIEDLIEAAAATREPAVVAESGIALGGVDPLGLRQINFDLMDKVFPGINNAAAHIRPFTVVTWAWRRAGLIAQQHGKGSIPLPVLEDFVARIEVIYSWSQFLRDRDAGLPGRDVLAPLRNADAYAFAGKKWEQRKRGRAYSTALSAPVNYGPALKAFHWLQPARDGKGALAPTELAEPAVAALDEAMAPYLEHPAFSSFGKVTVSADDVDEWSEAWALEEPSGAERRVMAEAMTGETAPVARRDGVALVLAAHRHLGGDPSHVELRRTMCGAPTDFVPPSELDGALRAWRTVQVRQTFRLALEAMLAWAFRHVEEHAATTGDLVQAFLAAAGEGRTAGAWLDEVRDPEMGPVDWLEALEGCLRTAEGDAELPWTIRAALAHSLAEAPEDLGFERLDRLPLSRAAREAEGWRFQPVAAFVGHVLDAWVFGQHVYWSVGRGLGDARAGVRTLLRLKLGLEETGWTPMPGAKMPAPRATPDRLSTMLSLMSEAGVFSDDG